MKFANPQKKSRVVATTFGHAVEYPGRIDSKDKAASDVATAAGHMVRDGFIFVHTPPPVVAAAVSAGLVPEEDAPEEHVETGPVRPADPAAVEKALFDVFDVIVRRAEREDFSAAGIPRVPVVGKELGWHVHSAEVRDTWNKYQLAKAGD